jgi:hypothetical protein
MYTYGREAILPVKYEGRIKDLLWYINVRIKKIIIYLLFIKRESLNTTPLSFLSMVKPII